MEASNLELLALVLFILVLAATLEIWVRISEAGENIRNTLESPETMSDEEQVAADIAFRNKALYWADRYNESCNAVGTDEYKRRLNAGIANQNCASMEPFCGEGDAHKKSREAVARAIAAARASMKP